MKIFPFIKKTKWKLPFASSMQLAIFNNKNRQCNIKMSDGTVIDQTERIAIKNFNFNSDQSSAYPYEGYPPAGTYPLSTTWDNTRIDGNGVCSLSNDGAPFVVANVVEVVFSGGVFTCLIGGNLISFRSNENPGITYTIKEV